MFDTLYELIHGESSWKTMERKQELERKESQLKIDKQLKVERTRAKYMQEIEEKSILPNDTFNSINTQFEGIIEARSKKLHEADTFIANANHKLRELGIVGMFKSYKKGNYYYQIAFASGHYKDPMGSLCLRGRVSDEDDIKVFKDFYTPVENFEKLLPQMRPFFEMNLQNIIDFYEFLPDFYETCLKSLENNANKE